MRKNKFITKEQFNEVFRLEIDETVWGVRVSVIHKATDKLVLSSKLTDSREKALNEVYFQMNVVNYVSV